jgi:3-oxoacyl-[acyl-carrier protein] reductase
VALVTGSSRGLGRSIAERLAGDGMAVAVNGLTGDPGLDEVARAIGGVACPADITDEDQVSDLVGTVTRRLGPIDVVVLNATGPQPDAAVDQAGWREHLDQLVYFVKSPVLIGRAVIGGMRERGFGRLVHIDSEVADRPPVGRSAYVTAKAAQVGLVRSWAVELAPYGITVNTVAPGFIPVERHADLPPEVLQAYRASVPAGRMGVPDDVAHAASFLASDQAGFITGQRILVNGGRSVRA